MNTSDYSIYSDASFDPRHNVAVIGYLFVENKTSSTNAKIDDTIWTQVIEEKNNIRAELRGVIIAIEALLHKFESPKKYQIDLFTDCQAVSNLLKRRDRLVHANFKSKTTGKQLSNGDLYRQFFSLYDQVTPKITWVKGHTVATNRGLVQGNFRKVDRAVRKKLRSIVFERPITR